MSEQIKKASNVLFIGNLPYSFLDNEFHALVSEYGEVATATVVRDERERSRGFGFVRYVSDADAVTANEALEGKELDGRNLRSSFARADSRYVENVLG